MGDESQEGAQRRGRWKLEKSSWREEDLIDNIVECPLCGYKVCAKGLGSHKNSKRCKVRQTVRERESRGEISFTNKTLLRGLEEIGAEWERDYVDYRVVKNWPWHYHTEMVVGYWAREGNIERAKKEVLDGYTSYGVDVLRKIDEMGSFLILKKEGKGTVLTFRKDDPSKTRKRKFKIRDYHTLMERRELEELDKILYDNEGNRFGEFVEMEDLPGEVKDRAIYWVVRGDLKSS